MAEGSAFPSRIRRPPRPAGFSVPLRIACFALCLLPSPARPATWIVDPGGGGNVTTIAAALGLAALGDTVEVTCGTYFERGLLLPDSVHIRSQTGQPECVTIDAGGLGRVFRAINALGVEIVGLTITNGDADYGGGALLLSSSTIRFESCVFAGNSALLGGGIYCHHSPIRLEGCTVSGNTATYHGGGLVIDDFASPTITASAIVDNVAGEDGGGIWCYYASSPSLDGTRIAGNEAGGRGGALHFVDSAPALTGCVITGNVATDGGAIAGRDFVATVSGCTVAANRATGRGGGIFGGLGSGLSLTHTILWADCAPDGREIHLEDGGSFLTFDCCDVDTASGGVAGNGDVSGSGANFHDDPLFCGPVSCASAPTPGGDYELQAGSTCLPAGSGGCGLIGAQGQGACRSAAATGALTWGRVKAQFRTGQTR